MLIFNSNLVHKSFIFAGTRRSECLQIVACDYKI
jgi:hypothetical protein